MTGPHKRRAPKDPWKFTPFRLLSFGGAFCIFARWSDEGPTVAGVFTDEDAALAQLVVLEKKQSKMVEDALRRIVARL